MARAATTVQPVGGVDQNAMSVAESKPAMPTPKLCRLHVTPGRVLAALLVVEGLLWLSERFAWLPWHKGYAVLTAMAVVAVALLGMMLWFVLALRFRWRFQFSIRSLLVLTVVVALPFSWLAAKMQEARATLAAIEAINEVGGFVSYGDFGGPLDTIYFPPDSGWLAVLLGDEYESVTFYNNTAVTDAALEDFAGLKHVQKLNLTGTKVTDVGLERLKKMEQLETLELNGTEVTDAGLENLKGLDHLLTLGLFATKITDAGLEHLKGLNRLQQLRLDGTHVTDTGLEYLKGLKQLEVLSLGGTKVTDAGGKKLQQALPKCQIYTDFN